VFLITSHSQFDNDKYNKYLPVGYEHATNNPNNETNIRGSDNVTSTLETVLTKLNNLPTTDNALSSSSSSCTADTLKRKRTNQEDQELLGADIASSPDNNSWTTRLRPTSTLPVANIRNTQLSNEELSSTSASSRSNERTE